MTAYDPAIARFATEGKNVNSTYDDKIERDVMLKESNNILFPNDTTMKNYSEHKMDLQVVDKDQNIKAFIEVERSRSPIDTMEKWKNVGVLQRKVKSVLEFSAIAPVIMVFLNKAMTRYYMLRFLPSMLEKYPLELIQYNAETLAQIKKDREYPKPTDYKHHIPVESAMVRLKNIGAVL